MRRVFAAIGVAILLLAALCCVPACAWAAQVPYTIDRLATDLYVETDSSVHVVERQTLTFDQPSTGLVWYLHEADERESVKIESVRAAKLDADGALEGEWMTMQLVDSDPARQGRCPGDAAESSLRGPETRPWYSYSISDGMLRCFFPADGGTYLVETDYIVTNRVRVFKDVGELYWRYANSDLPVDARDASLLIALPVPAESVIEPNVTVRAWGHGPSDGTFVIGEDGSVVYHVDLVKAGHYAEAHILFPAHWIANIAPNSPRYRYESRRLEAVDEEADWLDSSARASIWDNKVRAASLPLAVLAALAAAITVLALGETARSRRWLVRYATALAIVALFEQLFFQEPLTTALLLAAAVVIGLAALLLPRVDAAPAEGEYAKEVELESAAAGDSGSLPGLRHEDGAMGEEHES